MQEGRREIKHDIITYTDIDIDIDIDIDTDIDVGVDIRKSLYQVAGGEAGNK